MAGADRVEGTLFGNGERTGNVDVVTLALNMFTQGVDPELEIHDIDEIIQTYEHCNQLPVASAPSLCRRAGVHRLLRLAPGCDQEGPGRAGARATAASGTCPTCPIDPSDLGRSYEAVIRINSQSGKGGVSYILEQGHGLRLPRRLQIEFSQVIQRRADESGKELQPGDIWRAFQREYLPGNGRFGFVSHQTLPDSGAKGARLMTAEITDHGKKRSIEGKGNGPIDAFVDALREL